MTYLHFCLIYPRLFNDYTYMIHSPPCPGSAMGQPQPPSQGQPRVSPSFINSYRFRLACFQKNLNFFRIYYLLSLSNPRTYWARGRTFLLIYLLYNVYIYIYNYYIMYIYNYLRALLLSSETIFSRVIFFPQDIFIRRIFSGVLRFSLVFNFERL